MSWVNFTKAVRSLSLELSPKVWQSFTYARDKTLPFEMTQNLIQDSTVTGVKMCATNNIQGDNCRYFIFGSFIPIVSGWIKNSVKFSFLIFFSFWNNDFGCRIKMVWKITMYIVIILFTLAGEKTLPCEMWECSSYLGRREDIALWDVRVLFLPLLERRHCLVRCERALLTLAWVRSLTLERKVNRWDSWAWGSGQLGSSWDARENPAKAWG